MPPRSFRSCSNAYCRQGCALLLKTQPRPRAWRVGVDFSAAWLGPISCPSEVSLDSPPRETHAARSYEAAPLAGLMRATERCARIFHDRLIVHVNHLRTLRALLAHLSPSNAQNERSMLGDKKRSVLRIPRTRQGLDLRAFHCAG